MRDTVLVVADEHEASADRVIHALAGHDVGVVRFSLADVPTQLGITAEFTPGTGQWDGALAGPKHWRGAELQHVRAVYYRRPEPPVIDKHVPDRYRTWAQQQALGGTLGILYSLDQVRWVNHPERAFAAAHKPVQLHAAAETALTVPRTLITTDADAARLFVKDVDEAVCKPVASMMITRQDGSHSFVPTHVVTADEIDDTVGLTVHMFQEWVPKQFEVRLTVVGREMFAGAIHAGSDAAQVDWRTDYDALTYSLTDVPDDVRAGVLSLMNQWRLSFGAFDFAVRPDGRWVFFECNPAGQWAWIETATGAPIAAALARLLAGGHG